MGQSGLPGGSPAHRNECSTLFSGPLPCPLGPGCSSHRAVSTQSTDQVENRESASVWRLTMTNTRCFRGSCEPGLPPGKTRHASRQLLVIQRVRGFTIQAVSGPVNDLDVSQVARLSFQIEQVGPGSPFEQRGAVFVHPIELAEQFLG